MINYIYNPSYVKHSEIQVYLKEGETVFLYPPYKKEMVYEGKKYFDLKDEDICFMNKVSSFHSFIFRYNLNVLKK